MSNTSMDKPKLAVFKFASCDGCQLSLLDCEDELLSLSDKIEIAFFIEATKTQLLGPYDLTLVEGSVTTPQDQQRIISIREQSRYLVTIGACATSGGIQALRNFQNIENYKKIVYAKPEYISTLSTSTAIAENLPVDFELQGCPINKYQLLEVCKSFLIHKKPNIPAVSVCTECKIKGNPCIMVTQGVLCMGPVTHAGCDALCPTYQRGCYGCYGPKESPNPQALAQYFDKSLKTPHTQILQILRNFNANHPALKKASQDYES